MNIIEPIVVVSGLVLGSLIVLAVIFSYLKGRKMGSTDLLLTLIGVVLVSLSLWQSITFAFNEKGLTGELKKALTQVETNKSTILKNDAALNNDVSTLNREIKKLTADITALKQKNTDIQVSQEELNRRKQEEAKRQKEEAVFQNNAEYSVFVFYRSYRSQEATKTVQALLKAGYSSSMIMSDLTEVAVRQPDGTTSVIYTERGKPRVQDIERILRGLGLGNITIEKNRRPELGRGDINIYLF